VEAALERNLEKAYAAFRNDPLVNIPDSDAKALFDEMVENTKAYLTEYKI
jgi:alpha-galactosidase